MKKNRKKEKAKFFCESCGSEVNQNARVCTYCGKFFSSVRCPNCGKTGKTEEFIHGCPDCGYAVSKGKNAFNSNSNLKYFNNNVSSLSKNTGDGHLPIWIYCLCVSVLIVLVVCLYSCL